MQCSILFLTSVILGIWSDAEARSTKDDWLSIKSNSRNGSDLIMPRMGNDLVIPKEGNDLIIPKATVGCGQYELDPEGSVVIKSKNYPANYDASDSCTWQFTVSDPTSTISVRCTRINVRKSRRCRHSSLTFSDGSNTSQKICGRRRNYSLTTSTNTLNVVFSSGRRRTAKGFMCRVTASEGTAASTTSAPTTIAPSTVAPTTSDPNSDCVSCGTVNRATRIVGGIATEVNEYPWQVALVYAGTNNVFCGGSIHNEQYIITAAHCGEAILDNNINTEVLLGAHNVDTGSPAPQRIAMASVVNHPDYNNRNLDNDIAVLRLSSKATLNDEVKPACLPDPSKDYSNMNAIVSGWGVTSEGGNQPSELLEVEVPTLTNSECNNLYGSGITDNMICAGLRNGGKDACQGDSGGPLAVEDGGKWVLVGVVSWGYGCARPNYPGVYARVTKYIDWINRLTSDGGSLCSGETGVTNNPITTTKAPTTAAPATTQAPQPRCVCGRTNAQTRIVGGQVTEVHEYPWQAALVSRGQSRPFCGASIIANQWILTAAHCLPSMTTSNSQVIIGEHNWSTQGETSATQRLNIERLISHPNYNSNTMDNDIALIKVSSTISFPTDNKVAPVCLPTSSNNLFDNVNAIVSGWGTLSSGGSQPSTLNDVTVPTMSNSNCRQSYGGTITSNMLCAGLQQGGKDSCQGDSGGPLVTLENNFYMQQIGVVSFGYGCAEPNYPGVYARVTSYLSWISNNIGSSETCSPPSTSG